MKKKKIKYIPETKVSYVKDEMSAGNTFTGTNDYIQMRRLIKEMTFDRKEIRKIEKRIDKRVDRIYGILEEISENQKRSEVRTDKLENAVTELAQAQKRTEERVEELAQAQKRTEERVEELAQAQKRTEERVEELAQAQKRTEERVEELAQAQKRTEERVEELAQALQKLTSRVDTLTENVNLLTKRVDVLTEAMQGLKKDLAGLSDTVGFSLEDIAKIVLPGYLERHLKIKMGEFERKFIKMNEKEIEINLYGEGTLDSEKVVIIGESKSKIGNEAVRKFIKDIEGIEKVINNKIIKVMFGYVIYPSAKEIGDKENIILVASYQR